MAGESTVANAIRPQIFFDKYLSGKVIDIGCGPDLVIPSAEPFDKIHGDAETISQYREREHYDTVYSSHCLEHMRNVPAALEGWWSLVKPGGHMVIVVPDEELYEQGIWPSLFNQDHKATFTLKKNSDRSSKPINVIDLFSHLDGAEIVSLQLQTEGYDRRYLNDGISPWGRFLYRAFNSGRRRLRRRFGNDRVLFSRVVLKLLSGAGMPVDQTQLGSLAQIQVVVQKHVDASNFVHSDIEQTCRLCGGRAVETFRAKVLEAHLVKYYECVECGSLQTEDPYWLDEAYSMPFAETDTGVVRRSTLNAALMSSLLRTLRLKTNAPVLDFGGGVGLLVRMLRDAGVNAFHFDKYGDNLFAPKFRWPPDSTETPSVVTAFEVFEHFAKPNEEFERLFSLQPDFVVATTVFYEKGDRNWWYLGLDHGQHVFFYSRKSLDEVARKYGFSLATFHHNFFVFSRAELSRVQKVKIWWTTSFRVRKAVILYNLLIGKRALDMEFHSGFLQNLDEAYQPDVDEIDPGKEQTGGRISNNVS